MSNSYKKPIIKDKNKFMQKYMNRQERKLAKDYIRKGNFIVVENKIVPHGSYDICDWIFDFRFTDSGWWNFTDREWHKIIGK